MNKAGINKALVPSYFQLVKTLQPLTGSAEKIVCQCYCRFAYRLYEVCFDGCLNVVSCAVTAKTPFKSPAYRVASFALQLGQLSHRPNLH